MNLAPLDTKQIALVLKLIDQPRVVRGTATYERDPLLGPVLRIRPGASSPGNPEFILREETWQGKIVPDDSFGCDFCIELAKV